MQNNISKKASVDEQTAKKPGFLKNSRFSGWQLGIFAAVFAFVLPIKGGFTTEFRN